MLHSVDSLLHVKTPSGRHIGPDIKKDFGAVLKVLQDEQVLKFKSGRKHRSFPNTSSDPFAALRKSPKGFHKWLKSRRKAATVEAQLSSQVF